MHFRHLLAVLALVCAAPAYAANTEPWVDAISGRESGLQPGGCVSVRFTTANETAESKWIYVGGLYVTIQMDPDTAAAAASSGDIVACNAATTTSCGPLNLVDTNADGVADDNTLDGTAGKRGTLDPIAVAGWLYWDPDGATVDTNEVQEVTVCAVR